MPPVTAPGEPAAASSPEDYVPIPVAELELASEQPAPRPNALGQIAVLVRLHGVPLGALSLMQRDGSADRDLRAHATRVLREPLLQHLQRDGLTLTAEGAVPSTTSCALVHPGSARQVSVVICTLGEDPRLVQTVRSVLAQTHENLELLVVDNRPASGRVRAMLADVDDPRLRILAQPRPGLSAARNAGAAAAHGSVVAFTDDDAFADAGWVHELTRPFDEHPDVVCTTGLVLPAEIVTPAQAWFEEFGAFDKGFARTVWTTAERPDLAALGRRGEGGVLFPYSAGVYGSGNNMAFRSSWLQTSGLFDEALGAGTIARGGEDLDAFLTVMLGGGVLVYDPRAIVKHYARSDMAALQKQMYGYGSGMAAVVVKHFVASPRRAVGIAARLPAGLRRLLDPRSEKNAAKSTAYPPELARSELSGYAAGPVLYLRSRRQAARRRRSHPDAAPGS